MPPHRTTREEPADTPHQDPTDIPLPDDEGTPDPSEETPNLAEAITLMTTELRHCDNNSGTKVKEPDTFDGSDPHKLNNFILLCTLYFQNNPTCYNDAARLPLHYLTSVD